MWSARAARQQGWLVPRAAELSGSQQAHLTTVPSKLSMDESRGMKGRRPGTWRAACR